VFVGFHIVGCAGISRQCRHVHKFSGYGWAGIRWRRRGLGIATDLHKTGKDSFTLIGIGKDKTGGRR
jgi:hypothetical protein